MTANHLLAMVDSLNVSPRVNQWLSFAERGKVLLLCDKVELGQGIITAFHQIAANSLGLPISQVRVVESDTARSPNQGYTAGSLSVEAGGTDIRRACRTAVAALRSCAADRLGCAAGDISFRQGKAFRDGTFAGIDYWDLAPDLPENLLVTAQPGWEDWSTAHDENMPRIDLPAKLAGGAFIHDFTLPDMLHARILRPPSPFAELVGFEERALPEEHPKVRLLVEGNYVAFIAEREDVAAAALERMRPDFQWREPECLPAVANWAEWLMEQPTDPIQSEIGQRVMDAGTRQQFSATYSRPPLAHASIGPSCAVAQFSEGELIIWSHTQGVFPLRTGLAAAFDMSEEQVRVLHKQGAGAYGHNGADDAAFDAAKLALAFAPRPVRVQWTRADELAWSPFGSPMAVRITADLGSSSKIVDWNTEIWSGRHNARPGFPDVPNFLGAGHCRGEATPELPDDLAFVGADRNAVPLYAIPRIETQVRRVKTFPLRCSSLRTLGAFSNIFAIESFMDELAHHLGEDPVDFRFRHLNDSRARRVLERAANAAQYPRNNLGVALSRYKNSAAYAAVIAEVELGDDLKVKSMWCAFDAGLLINPDGAANQIEGGIIQGLSWTLKESIRFDRTAVTSSDWEHYPILRFDEVPRIFIEAVHAPDEPPLGVGEATQGVAAAAIANAFAAASGLRIRDLPLNRDAILAAVANADHGFLNRDSPTI